MHHGGGATWNSDMLISAPFPEKEQTNASILNSSKSDVVLYELCYTNGL